MHRLFSRLVAGHLLFSLRAVAGGIVLLGIVSSLSAFAHEGHDHGAPPPPVDAATAPRAEAYSDVYELVAVRGQEEILLYLDRFKSNEPVSGALIEADTPTGILKATPRGEGVYALKAPFVAKPGSHPLTLTILEGAQADLLTLTLVVPDEAGAGMGGWLRGLSAPSTPVPVRDVVKHLPDGVIFVPKATQRILGLRNLMLERGSFDITREWPGRVIADPNSSALIQSPVVGRLRAPENGFPALGSRVNKGDVLAYILAVMSLAESADLRQRLLETDQQLTLARRKLARLRPVADIIPRQQIEEAQIEVKGLESRLKALKTATTEGEPIRAPVSGIIASASVTTGQVVEPNSVMFQIVDPAKLWVETQGFESDPRIRLASARTSDGTSFALSFRGAGLASVNQTIPAHFVVEGKPPSLRIGQMVIVSANVAGSGRSGLVLPRSSLVRSSNGTTTVFEHAGAERFTPRPIRFESLDAQNVLVTGGIEAKTRIITQGAELLGQVR
jgi:membrane fusion protein, heavy metal efflux system